jgi:drug/metabolite transporter (DMT)-like permease
VNVSNPVLRAVAISLAALLLLDLMGLIIKHLAGAYGVAELTAYRNLFGIVPSLIVLATSKDWRAGRLSLRIRQWPLACLRGIFVTIAQFLFYLAVARLAYATAATITYSMSLFATALSVLILRDRVGALRWTAVAIGFAGVVLVMGPGTDSFTRDALLPLGAAFFYALSSVTVRRIDTAVPSTVVYLYSAVTAAVGALVYCLASDGFTPIATARDFAWIVAMGTFGGFGVLLLVVSYRMTAPSNLAPFNYFGILSAFVLAWIFFGEAPFDRLFPGVLFIIAGGLMIVWRERRAARLG